ncbi:MAG: hypothetical protein Q9220_000015 [cf. Caloplaca sp. 1 TL-2023]
MHPRLPLTSIVTVSFRPNIYLPSTIGSSILNDTTHVLRPLIVSRLRSRPKQGLWVRVSANGFNGKATVRRWAKRRVTQALRLELRERGWEIDGMHLHKDGRVLRGTMELYAKETVVAARWPDIRSELGRVVDAVVSMAEDKISQCHGPLTQTKMLISLTVGKVDAGVAVLLTEDKRLIEFPSILLPPSISSGSIVDITVSRNLASEAASQKSFQSLQSSILSTYGQQSPTAPILRCRNATQTSIVLEWDPVSLATAELRSLSLYRNGSKAGNIPKPMEMTSTKMSGLAVDTEYNFQLLLRTSAGVYNSERLIVRTHKMTDLSGITVTPGMMAPPLRESLSGAIDRIGGKIAENVRIDTTHFVCMEGRGREWEKAVEMNIPVVRPEWVEGCEREGRIVGVRGYYLNADPKLRQVGQGVGFQSPQRQQQQPQQPRGEALRQGRTNSSASISNTQLPRRGPQEPAPSPSANNLRASNQPPPSASPSERGSPAPPPPEKDTPKEAPHPDVSPIQSMASKPGSPEGDSALSPTVSSNQVSEQSLRNLKPTGQENGSTSPKRADNASMVDVAL